MLATLSGRNPSQNEIELRGFVELLIAEGVRSYLEIGAREGDTFHEIMRHLPKGSRGVAVDLPGGLWGKASTRGQLEIAVRAVRELGYDASCLFGDSKTIATRAQITGRGPYDAILIDGDHTLEGVTADWQHFREHAPLVAFHDIVGAGERENVHGHAVEVPLLWERVKARASRAVEFVAPGSRMGIGVVWTSP